MSDPGVAKLGERIAAIAKQHGGVTELARILDITPARLRNWTQGKNEPSAYYLRRLAHLGNVSVGWLVSHSEDAWQEWQWLEARRFIDGLIRYVDAERRFTAPQRKEQKQ